MYEITVALKNNNINDQFGRQGNAIKRTSKSVRYISHKLDCDPMYM